MAGVSDGNFLVLKLLCEHTRAAPLPERVRDFLRQLSTSDREALLGFICQEFWERLPARATLEELEATTDVAEPMRPALSSWQFMLWEQSTKDRPLRLTHASSPAALHSLGRMA